MESNQSSSLELSYSEFSSKIS